MPDVDFDAGAHPAVRGGGAARMPLEVELKQPASAVSGSAGGVVRRTVGFATDDDGERKATPIVKAAPPSSAAAVKVAAQPKLGASATAAAAAAAAAQDSIGHENPGDAVAAEGEPAGEDAESDDDAEDTFDGIESEQIFPLSELAKKDPFTISLR